MMRKRAMECDDVMSAQHKQQDGPHLKRQCTESSLSTGVFGTLRHNNTFSSFPTNSSPVDVGDNMGPMLAAQNMYEASAELAYRPRAAAQNPLSDAQFEPRNGAVNHQAEARARFDSGVGGSESSGMPDDEMMDMGDAIDTMSDNAMALEPLSAPSSVFSPRQEAVESMGSALECTMMPSMVTHMVQPMPFKQRAYEFRCVGEWRNDYY